MKDIDFNNYAKNCLKPPKAFFEWVYSRFGTYRWSNKEREIIASDRKHSYCKEKRLTKNSRLTFTDTAVQALIILSTAKRIEVQTYKIYSCFKDGKQYFSTSLLNLEIFTNGQQIKLTKDYGEGYRKGTTPITGLAAHYPTVFFDDNGWEEKLSRNNELKYLDTRIIDWDNLSRVYKYRYEIEYAQKIKAYRLVEDIAHSHYEVDMRRITKRWLKNNKSFFKNSGRNYQTFLLKEELEKNGSRYLPGIEIFIERNQICKIPKELDTTKFLKYLIRQDKSFNYYQDYLNLSKDIGIENDEIEKMPSNLVKEHDKAVEILNTMKRELTIEGFKSKAEKLKRLESVIGEFVFILPKDAEELVVEGKELKHCVGGSSYINNHAEDRTTIVFVRKKESPEKSFFTLEYKNNRIQQLQGFKNKEKVSNELQKAADEWLVTANNEMKRLTRNIANRDKVA